MPFRSGIDDQSRDVVRLPEFPRLAGAMLTLTIVVYLVQLAILDVPDYGFQLAPRTWEVVSTSCSGAACPQRGDRLLKIGDVTFERFSQDRSVSLPLVPRGEVIEIELLREGEARSIAYSPPEGDFAAELATVSGTILLPIVFWLAGTSALLFLRPLGKRGRLYISLFYVLALFFASSWAGWAQVGYSWYLQRLARWALLPLLVHFHMVFAFPTHEKGWDRPAPLYLIAALGFIADLKGPRDVSIGALLLLLAIIFSCGLLLVGSFRSERLRSQQMCRIMLAGLVGGTGPFLVLLVLPALAPSVSPQLSNPLKALLAFVVILSVPLWPASYLYAVYFNREQSLRFRANKWLGEYGFYALLLTAFLSTQMIGMRMVWTPESTETGNELGYWLPVILSSLILLSAPRLLDRFQRWVDAKVFGLNYEPEEVLQAFARRIPMATDAPKLRQFVIEEILPTLMVKQSALYMLGGDDVDALYVKTPGQPMPRADVLRHLVETGPHHEPFDDESEADLGWVRLALPITAEDKMFGVWLFGDRDPDDRYPAEDVELLVSLANMIGAVAQGQEAAAAKSTFLANVSHEIRTPMNGVLGMVEILSKTDLTPTQQDHCETIRASGESLLRLLDDILDLAKMEAGRLTIQSKPFDLHELLERVVRRGEPMAQAKGLRLVLDDPVLGRFQGDPGRIAQILDNLVSNAIKFTDRGTIRLAARQVVGDDGESRLSLSVIDTGIGIAPSQRDKIFEKFAQVDPSITRKHSGTGLGLAICLQLSELMGGDLSVASEEGKGSTFRLDLPLEQLADSSSSIDLLPLPAKKLDFSHQRALVVEDNVVNSFVVQEMLASMNLDVEAVTDGQQAVDRTRDQPFDIVLMDCQMPVMDGLEATQRIRDRERGNGGVPLQIIGFTAHALPEEIDRCIEAGMDEVLVKPVRLETLREMLSRRCEPAA